MIAVSVTQAENIHAELLLLYTLYNFEKKVLFNAHIFPWVFLLQNS